MRKEYENILKYCNIMNDTNEIAKLTKQSNIKIQSTIVTMARKNFMSKERAKALLKDSPMIKFIDIPIKCGLSKPLPTTNERYNN